MAVQAVLRCRVPADRPEALITRRLLRRRNRTRTAGPVGARAGAKRKLIYPNWEAGAVLSNQGDSS
jgi:hypothetical protein